MVCYSFALGVDERCYDDDVTIYGSEGAYMIQYKYLPYFLFSTVWSLDAAGNYKSNNLESVKNVHGRSKSAPSTNLHAILERRRPR